MNEIAYLNQEYLPLTEAKIPVFDRGFLFGDSIYEVIPVYQGVPFGLDLHLERLEHSLAEIFLTTHLGKSDWIKIFTTLLEKNSMTNNDCCIYLQITRGTYMPRKHNPPQKTQANILVMLQTYNVPSVKTLRAGFRVMSCEDIRWQRCDIKTTSLLGNILLLEQAQRADTDDVIMIRNGIVTEGSSSNAFIVHRGCIITPPSTRYILNGITRQTVLMLAKKHQLDCVERDIHITELETADEIWLTSSSKEITPVLSLNHQPVGDGTPGPVWEKMIDIFQDYRRSVTTG